MKRLFAALFILLFSVQTALAGSTAPSNLEWHLSRVGAQSAWLQGADGHGVSVLVIDTGLDKVMAETTLKGQVLPSYTANPLHEQVLTPCKYYVPFGEACTKTITVKNPSPYTDDIGHGSFVLCEIVCNGQSYNYFGIAPRAKAAMAKVFGSADGADSNDIANAIRWGAIHHFTIISMSLGGSFDTPTAQAVIFAIRHGSLVVAAAGNAGHEGLSYPAGDQGVIAVGASTRWDTRASFSQYGAGLAITAPGDFIFGVAPMHPTLINCGGLCQWEGTSMATPQVAGALADLISWGLSPRNAETALFGGARHWPGMDRNQYGSGILDLNGAMHYAQSHHFPRHPNVSK